MDLVVGHNGVPVVLMLGRQCHTIITSEGLTLLKISSTLLSIMETFLHRDPQEAALVLGSKDRLLKDHHLMAVDMIIMDKEVDMQQMLRYLRHTLHTCQVIMHLAHLWHHLILRQITIMPSLEVQIMLTLHLTPKLHHLLKAMVMDMGSRSMIHRLQCNSSLMLDKAMRRNKEATHPNSSTIGHHPMACHHRAPLPRVMPLQWQVSLLQIHLIKLLLLHLSLMVKTCLHSSNIHKLHMVLHL